MALQIGVDLLREVHATLRACGAGCRECVCYLTGPLDLPGVLDGVLHPDHRANATGYEVDPRWLNATWVELAATGREVRLQVHTHPGEAYHSPTDDAYPLVRTPGFFSLVLPRFASTERPLDGAFLVELDAAGTWHAIGVDQGLVIR